MFKPSSAATPSSAGDDSSKLEEPRELTIGLSLPQEEPDAFASYDVCVNDGYKYCTTELPKDVYQNRSDVTALHSHYWNTSVVGVLPERHYCGKSGEDWNVPLEWAWHVGLPVVIVPSFPTTTKPFQNNNTRTQQQEQGNGVAASPAASNDQDSIMGEGEGGDYPVISNNKIMKTSHGGVSVPFGDGTASVSELPLLWDYARKVGHAAMHAKRVQGHLWILATLPGSVAEAQLFLQHWKLLNQLLNHPENVGLLLDVKYSLNSSSSTSMSSVAWGKLQVVFLHHLMGMAALRGLRFSCGDFLTNKGGFPTLSRGVQFLIGWLLQRLGDQTLRLLVQGPPTHFTSSAAATAPSNIRGATECLPYIQYLQHIRKRPDIRSVLDTHQARMEEDHCDRLQQPLQPLRDHLDNATYEVFEADPIKYREYQRAISMALTDFVINANNMAPKVVLVVGAGRGPLVSCVVQAYDDLPPDRRPQSISVYAVEKNPSAIIYLQSLVLRKEQKEWTHLPVKIQVLHSDLRRLSAAVLHNQQADLIVSELLGSFGDNELSPECLDALFTQTNVCHANTVSIPTRYTAYLAPVSSIKLYQKVREQALYPNDSESSNGTSGEGNGVLGMQVATETPYVVRPRAASQMGPALPCWTFAHPNKAPGGETNAGANMGNELNQSVFLEFGCGNGSISPQWGCGYGPMDEKLVAMLDDSHASSVGSSSTPTAPLESTDETPNFNFPWLLTGFLGTFTADLYVGTPPSSVSNPPTVTISIVPETYSKGMYSWFPLYFPLEKPVLVPPSSSVAGGKGSVSVCAHMSRHSSPEDNRVWYEWSAVVQDKSTGAILDSTAIHNARGRSSFVSSL
ncbi:hypothetical protein ACA910_017091 [Epithemia clementina (nom. ined.)]